MRFDEAVTPLAIALLTIRARTTRLGLRTSRPRQAKGSVRASLRRSQSAKTTPKRSVADSDLINVRFGPLCGLKSDISRSEKCGDLNRSTQHLLILPDEEVCAWMHGPGSRRNRRLSCGSAGRAVNV